MLLLLSPAKTLDFEPTTVKVHSQPQLLEHSQKLVDKLQKLTVKDLQKLMGVSEKIASLNVERFNSFSRPFDLENAKQAILAFKGDVYQGLAAHTFEEEDLAFAQKHVAILSGLYGMLRPLDLMQPYRLEMGTKLKIRKANNLYEFWKNSITEQINATSSSNVVNLASNEYFKSVKKELLAADLWTVNFKDWKNDKFKIISFFAKKARGMMAQYVIKNRLENPEDLKSFDMEGYQFNPELSTERELIFTR